MCSKRWKREREIRMFVEFEENLKLGLRDRARQLAFSPPRFEAFLGQELLGYNDANERMRVISIERIW